MKPYLLVTYNYIRIKLKSLFGRQKLQLHGISMLSRHTRLSIDKTAAVVLGDRIVSDGRTVIIAGPNSDLSIGNRVYFNEDAMISCMDSVTIADGCKFGPNVKIFDNDHRFDAVDGVSANLATAPVTIGRNCWLASNVVVLRGTSIGDHCIIGANCVVKGSVPAGSIVTQARELSIRPIESREPL